MQRTRRGFNLQFSRIRRGPMIILNRMRARKGTAPLRIIEASGVQGSLMIARDVYRHDTFSPCWRNSESVRIAGPGLRP